jgi:alpha/beta superfamily hydrolase
MESVRFDSLRPSGAVELEGRLHLPAGEALAPGVVLCHPHPAGGGEMDVPLIRRLADELSSAGFASLRFNFGGVGASGGSFTDGVEEPADVAAAFEYLGSLEAVDAGRVSLTSWSFGSWMALMALADGLPALACAAVAPPLDFHDWAPLAARLAMSNTRRHYIVGEFDQFCSPDTLMEFAAAVSDEDTRNVTVLKDADHFLFGREHEVIDLVAGFLS